VLAWRSCSISETAAGCSGRRPRRPTSGVGAGRYSVKPMELLPLSIGLGLVVSLVFSEIFGLAAGGMVVPGYIALFLTRPIPVFLTLAAGFATFAIVRAL